MVQPNTEVFNSASWTTVNCPVCSLGHALTSSSEIVVKRCTCGYHIIAVPDVYPQRALLIVGGVASMLFGSGHDAKFPAYLIPRVTVVPECDVTTVEVIALGYMCPGCGVNCGVALNVTALARCKCGSTALSIADIYTKEDMKYVAKVLKALRSFTFPQKSQFSIVSNFPFPSTKDAI